FSFPCCRLFTSCGRAQSPTANNGWPRARLTSGSFRAEVNVMKVLLSSLLCLLLAAAAPAQDVPTVATLNVNVDLVELHVTVTDKKGRLIGGLTQAAFKVTENQIDQPIAVFK